MESLKVSFIRGIPELQWIVGAGVYLDDGGNTHLPADGVLYDTVNFAGCKKRGMLNPYKFFNILVCRKLIRNRMHK